jgi:hypothetical protein
VRRAPRCAGEGPLAPVLALVLVDGVLALVTGALTRPVVVVVTRPADLLAEANALLNVAFTVSMAVGPLAVGIATATLGPATGLALNAMSFLAAALAISGCPTAVFEPCDRAGVSCAPRG